MTNHSTLGIWRRAALALVRLYPRQFRRRFGLEIHRTVREAGSDDLTILADAAGVLARAWTDHFANTLSHLRPSRHREAIMGTLIHDLRFAVRNLLRRPGFAFLATGTLALGIGTHAALFSVVDGVLLTPLDLPRSQDLVIARMQVQGEFRNLTGPNLVDLLRETGDVFASAGGFWEGGVTIAAPDGTREQRLAAGATPGVFDALGVPLQLGRPWGPEAVGTGSVAAVVITDAFWRSRFGADSSVVGSTVVLNGNPVEITGVLPRGFEFPLREEADLVFPPVIDIAAVPRAGLGAFTLLARLQPGVSIERAQDEVRRVWEALRAQYPGDLRDNAIAVMGLQDYMVRNVRPALLALLGATSLLLLLAIANVANLMLAQGIRRGTEMSIRSSLGASRGRLVRQFTVESAVLAGFAGLAGILLATGSLAVLGSVAPPEMPAISEARLSLRALGFAVALAMACALLVGLVPAVRASHANLSGALRSGARATAGRKLLGLEASLVVAQIAVAVVLVIGAGLLIRSFSRLSNVNPGYRTEGVLTAEIIVQRQFYPDRASLATFFDRLEREVVKLPGVRRVGTTYRAPFSTGELSVPVRLADTEQMTLEDAPRAEIGIVSDGYLQALEIPVLQGRNFTYQDRQDSPRVVLVSETLARSLYGDEDPVGRRVAPVLGPWESATNWAEIVGVVGDIRLESLDAPAAGTLYLPSRQLTQNYATLMVQTAGDPAQLTTSLRDAMLRIEPRMVDPTIQTLASLRAESLARPRFNTLLLGAFSVLALTLAVVGIYGLLSYSVARRRLELGVRSAFGANPGTLLRLILTQGMKLTGLGLLIGLGGALFMSRALSALLFGITPADPTTYAGTLAGVAAIALVGCMVPGLRAARGNAVEALRSE